MSSRKEELVKERVPEGARATEEVQIKLLVEKLIGHDLFRKHRGKMGKLVDVLENLIGTSDSPTELLRRYDELTSAGRVFATMLGQLARDGCSYAVSELLATLRDETRLFWGEEMPLEDTEPITLVLVDPVRSLAFAGLFTRKHQQLFGWGISDDELDPEFVRVREMFPVLRGLRFGMLTQDKWSCVAHAYSCLLYDNKAVLRELDPEHTSTRLRLENVPTGGAFLNEGIDFARLVRGADQRAVLSRFNRAEQDQIATWQFSLPRRWLEARYTSIYVGLHPENEHERWKRKFPMFVSGGIQNGYGALVIPEITLHAHNARDHAVREYRERSDLDGRIILNTIRE
jgi:hypothetical protein